MVVALSSILTHQVRQSDASDFLFRNVLIHVGFCARIKCMFQMSKKKKKGISWGSYYKLGINVIPSINFFYMVLKLKSIEKIKIIYK